ncbi:MAG: DUF488 domain-containing protein [Planctomycetota bacterium]
MIKTKSAYDPVEESDGERILVSRYWPRGLSKERLTLTEHLKDVAPSIELLRDWKAGNISWAEYAERYRREMSQQQDKIEELAKRAIDKTITLQCFEREGDPHCHRHLLKSLIGERT